MINCNRANAVSVIAVRSGNPPMPGTAASINDFGEDVFTMDIMQQYLPKDVTDALLDTINFGRAAARAIRFGSRSMRQSHSMRNFIKAFGARFASPA